MPTRTSTKPSASGPGRKSAVSSSVEKQNPEESSQTAPPTAGDEATAEGATGGGAARGRANLDLDYFRSLLIAERGRLESELEQIRNRNTDIESALPEDGEGGDEDTADLAAAMMDKEMDLSVEDEIEDMLAQVDHAMQKMENGTYGICDMSGEPIPVSRLELIPWASLTAHYQALSEGE